MKTNNTKTDIKKISILAMMAALSYMLVVVVRIPFMPGASYLKLDVKDIPIMLGGFIYGPVSSVLMSLVVSFVEMITVSESGPIGFLMNFISTIAFVLPPVILYKKKKTIWSAALGLLLGTVFMTVMMMLWNYIITPFYQNVPRSVIKSMLVPVFLPFNFIKGIVNSALAFMIYKPLTDVLKHIGVLPKSKTVTGNKKSALYINIGAAVLLVLSVVVIIVLKK